MSHQVKTFADLIVAAHAQTPYAHEKYLLDPIASALPQAKRISYDRSFVELVDRTRSIDIEEILPQLARTKLPFHRLWIEGPEPNATQKDFETKEIPIVGMLVESKPGSDHFTFTTFARNEQAELMERMAQLKGYSMHSFIGNGKSIVQYFPTSVSVSADKGIDLNDDEFMLSLEKDSENRRLAESILDNNGMRRATLNYTSNDSSSLINNCYRFADFLARSFVLLGSDFAGKGAQLTKDNVDADALEHDKKRMKKDRVPLVPVRPIVIDMAKVPKKFFESHDPKETRQLLGWTSVRRTHVVNKYGTEFWRKPHDRRIAAEVDRRDVERKLTTTNDALRLELQAGQPIRILAQPSAQ